MERILYPNYRQTTDYLRMEAHNLHRFIVLVPSLPSVSFPSTLPAPRDLVPSDLLLLQREAAGELQAEDFKTKFSLSIKCADEYESINKLQSILTYLLP